MNYIFFGTPNFAAVILEKLIAAGFVPAAVVCNPDKPVGRKKTITKPPTKIIAEKHGIKAYQPQKLEIGNWKLEIGEIVYDFAVVAAYSKIIPKEILEIPHLGTIGIHPSLLPRHRGATPIQTAILSGDKTTGVTFFLADEKIDHGPILSGEALKIENGDTYETLEKKLADLGAELLVKILPEYISGKIKPQEQNEKYATYTKKFTTQDGYVDLEKDDPILIERKIRALNPEPGAWTTMSGKRTKLLEAEIIGGKLVLKKIQFEGKKPQKL